jgi:N6-L-threonylcarbamoyladenine synthase
MSYRDLKSDIILGIESSCDDTSAAILQGNVVLSNVIANQSIHEEYGGVVPELASRSHLKNIIPVVHEAIKRAGVSKRDIKAVAFTRGPGLLGSLLVGTSFAKGFAQGLEIPLIEVNHLQAHILAHFISEEGSDKEQPGFPLLCLLVSGGNSQLVMVKEYNDFELIGKTIDDAAGEAFDKCAKVMGLPYPGGPHIDRLAKEGNSNAFILNKPNISGYDYSFSGLKTSFLYLIRDKSKENPNFVAENRNDLSASLQKTIIEILMNKLCRAAKDFNIQNIALSGGVSANSGLREVFLEHAQEVGWNPYVLPLALTTDNAAMVAMAGYFKYRNRDYCNMDATPYTRVSNLLK